MTAAMTVLAALFLAVLGWLIHDLQEMRAEHHAGRCLATETEDYLRTQSEA